MDLLSLIFPKTCAGCGKIGQYLCVSCASQVKYLQNQFCPVCAKAALKGLTHPVCQGKLQLDGLFSLVYFDYPVNKIIHKLKYKFVSDQMNELMDYFLWRREDFFDTTNFLVPIPLFNLKEKQRGFNQAVLLATFYQNYFKIPLNNSFLVRVKPTLTQAKLDKKARLENLKKAFESKRKLKGENLILVDDVWTTGATLRNAASVLKRNGAGKVWGFTLARSR